MDLEAFREALRCQPFKPFVICLSDGRRLPVTHRDTVAVGIQRAFVIEPDDSCSFIELAQIRSLDSISEQAVVERHTPIRPGSKEEIDSLSESFVLAIDLGFSKSRDSCGLAWKRGGSETATTGLLPFGKCIARVAELLECRCDCGDTAVLIVEAPLSGLFGKEGNPVERGGFERRVDASSGKKTTRYWYSGPGAAMCLAAAFFLRELDRRLCQSQKVRNVVLYEGFIAFKSEATDHVQDAQRLLESFFSRPCPVVPIQDYPGGSILTTLDIVAGTDAESSAPAIIVPSDAKTPE